MKSEWYFIRRVALRISQKKLYQYIISRHMKSEWYFISRVVPVYRVVLEMAHTIICINLVNIGCCCPETPVSFPFFPHFLVIRNTGSRIGRAWAGSIWINDQPKSHLTMLVSGSSSVTLQSTSLPMRTKSVPTHPTST